MDMTKEQEFFPAEGINDDLERRRGFRLSDRVIRHAVRSGELRGAPFGRQRLFKPSDVDDWLERRHAAATNQEAQAV